MEKIKRRSFIVLMFFAVGAALTTFFALDFKRVVKMILIKDTEKLKFETLNAIDIFLDDADKELFWDRFYHRKRIFLCVHHFFHVLGISLPRHHIYLQDRNSITGQFLFSTDLFWKGNTMTPVKYEGFFHPYKRPCANPFSETMSSKLPLPNVSK